MSHRFVARFFAALVVALTVSSTAALAGKEHCRKLTFDGVAGALSQDVVGFQVVRPDASVINQSDPTVQVLANESAIEFMQRIVEDWCTEDGTVCPTFTTPPKSFCANSAGDPSCKLKLKIAPKPGSLPEANVGSKKKYIEICCFEQPDCKKKLGKSNPSEVPITVQAQVNAGPECPLDSSLPLTGEAQCTVNLDPIGVIQLAAPGTGGCRSDLASAARSYVGAALFAYGECHKLRDSSGSPAQCLTIEDVDIKFKIGALAAKLQEVAQGCAADGSPANAGYAECPEPCAAFSTATCTAGTTGAPCNYDRDCDTTLGSLDGRCGDWAAVGGCIGCLLANTIESAAAQVLGNPGPVPLPAGELACHLEMFKAFERVVRTRLSEAIRCQTKVDGGKLTRPSGGEDCTTVDLKGLVAGAELKVGASIMAQCDDTQVAALGVCGVTTVNDYLECLLTESGAAAKMSATATFPELLPAPPGTCPTKATLLVAGGAVGPAGTCVDNGDCIPGDCVNGVCVNPTDVDYGWTGLGHDEDVVDKTAIDFDVFCAASEAPCGACTVSMPAAGDDNCRCQNDRAVRCDEPFSSDVDNCGGATCECFLGPPQPIGLSGFPVCVLHRLTGPATGTLDVDTSEAAFPVNENLIIHSGITQTEPCPTCVAGVCSGGERLGLPCSAPSAHGTFGPVTLDCPPSVASNISGTGLDVKLPMTTGAVSLPATLTCDPPFGAENCPCDACSLDPAIACSSDADCVLAGAGLCNTFGSGVARRPNACDDFTCSPIPGTFEGQCNAGPVDTFCDGTTYAGGDGLLPCSTNSDCAAFGPGSGNCTLSENRRCFVEPIAEAGFGAVSTNRLVGVTCMPPSSSSAVNNGFGLPGPARVALVTRPILTCSDGVSQYVPGVGGCP